MKERILEFLKEIALDKTHGLDRKKALVLMDTIIQNYHFFQVKTIDSFIKSVLSGCTFKMDFSSSFRIEEDYRENLAYSLDKLIDRTEENQKTLNLFVRFLKQYLYIENRVSWFVKRDILSLMETMFYLCNIYGDRFKKNDVESRHLIMKKKDILKSMKRLRGTAPEGTNQGFVKSLSSFLDKNRDNFDIDSIPNYFGNPDFPLNKGYSLLPKIEKLWREVKRDLAEVCELEAVSLFNPYIDIFDMALDVFKDLANRDDILFLEELNRQAKGLFDKSFITIGELYYRLATRLRHYLIDEFQDTSVLQWKNLFPMVEEALSNGGTFFCVGDRKQAIYRFRGGDVSLLDYVEERFKKFNVEHKSLNMNFRSQREIVEFNNEVFSEANLRRFIPCTTLGAGFTPADVEEIVKNFQGSRQSYRKENTQGYVKIERITGEDKEEREDIIKERIITLVKDLSKRFSYEGLAILARDNDEVGLVTGWLLEKGIPVESGKTVNIKRHPYIKEIISFIKFLDSPIDNLSFSSFILGDIFTKASGMSRRKVQDFIFEIRKKGDAVYLYQEFRERFPEAWKNLIDGFFRSSGFVPLYEFTTSIFSRFNVMKRFPEFQGFFMRFLELVKEQEEVNGSIPLFLDFFDKLEGDDLYVNIVDSKYVKVLTIHKSKGLEFSVVIIPFLSMDVRIGMGKNSGRSFTVCPGDNGLELKRLKKKYSIFSRGLDALYNEEYKKSFMDELNNIYVAFTRAKNELYIFIPEKARGKNIASLLIPGGDVKKKFGKPATAQPVMQTSNAIKIPVSRCMDWIPLLKDEFVNVFQIKNRSNLLKGEVFHYILSFIGNLSHQNTEKVVKDAMEKTHLKFPFVANLRKFKPVIKKVLKDKKLKQFFFIEDGVVYQEKEVINRFGDTCRIDRLILREGSVWIVDYKSSRDDMESFQKQIHKYVSAVKDLYPKKDVKGYLVFLDNFSVGEI